MSLQDITITQIVIVLAVIVVIIAAIGFWLERRRSEQLREHFGPEYNLAVSEVGGRRRAEARLEERAERVKKFHLRPLTAEDRTRFAGDWDRVQAHFVDAPAGAVAEADQLLGDIMATRGYPMGDFEQRAADVSVDHPVVTQHYRAAHDIAVRQAKGQASTEDLRHAMIHYRALFDGLAANERMESLSERRPVASERAAGEREAVTARRG